MIVHSMNFLVLVKLEIQISTTSLFMGLDKEVRMVQDSGMSMTRSWLQSSTTSVGLVLFEACVVSACLLSNAELVSGMVVHI